MTVYGKFHLFRSLPVPARRTGRSPSPCAAGRVGRSLQSQVSAAARTELPTQRGRAQPRVFVCAADTAQLPRCHLPASSSQAALCGRHSSVWEPVQTQMPPHAQIHARVQPSAPAEPRQAEGRASRRAPGPKPAADHIHPPGGLRVTQRH